MNNIPKKCLKYKTPYRLPYNEVNKKFKGNLVLEN